MNRRTRVYLICFCLALAISVTGYVFYIQPPSPTDVVELVSDRLADEIRAVDESAKDIETLITDSMRIELRYNPHASFFIIENGQVTAWSSHRFIPPPSMINDTLSLKHLKNGGSDYLIRKWSLSSDRVLVAVITLIRRYSITNDYLQPEWNEKIFPAAGITIIENTAASGYSVCTAGQCPFKIEFDPNQLRINTFAKWITLVFSITTLVFLFVVLNIFLSTIKTPDFAFVILAVALLFLRLTMTWFRFPADLLSGAIFDPQIFAASSLNASLGDLLINEIALFILCMFLFKNAFHFKIFRISFSNRISSWIVSVIAAFFVLLAMLYPFVVIQTLYNNSTIVLDISESLKFDSLRIISVIIILLSGVCSFLFSHAFLRVLIGDGNRVRIVGSFSVAAIAFILINEYTGQLYSSSLITGVVYLVVIYFLKLYSSLRKLSFATFTYLFVAIVLFSANSAFAVYHFGREEKIETQFRFARNFLIDRDYFAEYLLRELSGQIANDAFIHYRVNTPFLSKDAVRQKIRQVFLSNYFNKYDVSIYIFTGNNDQAENRSDVTLLQLLAQYDKDAYRTEYKGVFYVSSPTAEVTQKYLVVVPILKSSVVTSHIVVELSLKKVIPETVYPELLVDNRFLQFYRSQEISYGVYVDNDLSYSSGSFNYEASLDKTWFGDPALHTAGISSGGFDHIGQEDENGRIAIVSSRSKPFFHALANFSFLLVFGLITIVVFIFIQGFRNYLRGDPLYFSARIQLLLNLAFFLPLIIVSIMTLQVTSRSSQNQINEEYLNKTKKFSEQIASEITKRGAASVEDAGDLDNVLTDLSQLANLDANLYSAHGILSSTSQRQIFESNLFSTYIKSRALRKVNAGMSLFIEAESTGQLEYHTAYATVKSPATGSLLGILAIPFFQSSYSLERVQAEILANILNIFSIIFIALVALSYVVTRWLTFPLRFITQSLRKTSLTRVNQPLVWKSEDEIGMMVKEYNQMLFKLSESKAELEQTQRERAWREIAQQVAHEIKNPLTPMKLTLQQMERNLGSGTLPPERTQKAVSSLLTQVNTLDEIASSFSTFAKMPEPVMKPLELTSLLKRITDLHGHEGNISLIIPAREIFVEGDEQLLGRTFSNLILNGFQATIPGEPLRMDIIAKDAGEKIVIQFKDYGKGMEPATAERVFLPHFTTKKSGSGLGLAIAKQGIEQMNGQIWFETSLGNGTTFYIELPIVKQ